MDVLVFAVASVVAVGGALGVVLSRNPVHSALMLVMTLFGVAVLFVEQEAHFLAAVQVIVYAGAIVVLFLFVIMLLGVDRSEDLGIETLKAQRPLAGALALVAVLEMVLLVRYGGWVTGGTSVAGPGPRSRRAQRGAARPVDLQPLPPGVRGDVGAVGHRGRRRGRAGPAPAEHRPAPVRGRPVSIDASWYLAVGGIIFTIGAIGVLVRRNVLVMFMCVELMLNAVNLTFVTFARELNDIGGQVVVFFVLVVAAAEVVVGLGIIVSIFRRRVEATADDISMLKG